MNYTDDPAYAEKLDAQDPIAPFRKAFHIPKRPDGQEEIYLCGNSLGLQPVKTEAYLGEELEKWRRLAVKGHFDDHRPWVPYHELLAEEAARLVGGAPEEVVHMNTLTVNLHLLMVSFYHPTPGRFRILIEEHAFPSDHFAAESQAAFHGFAPEKALITVKPREGEACLQTGDILETIEREGDTIALILLPGVHYYTGQVLDMEAITRAGHAKGCAVGFDLAHAAGNVPMELHRWNVDFAAWCTYKYLNSGPGSVAGAFVHRRHHANPALPRLTGWWGHDKATRFRMENRFVPIPTAEAWMVSNSTILSLAAIRASLELFGEAGGIAPLREKSLKLTGYLRFLIETRLKGAIDIITPREPSAHGCQLSLSIKDDARVAGRGIFEKIERAGVSCDWREPNVIRVAPTPLYNNFSEVFRFVQILEEAVRS